MNYKFPQDEQTRIKKKKNHFSITMGIIYPVGTRSTWKAFLDCNSSSQTELAKVLPRDWNRVNTEGSHTLTSSVSDLTCNQNKPTQNLRKYDCLPKLEIQEQMTIRY